MLSFWEKESFLRYDLIILGSGITGLSTACSIMERNPKSTVLVLERGIFPAGASTKNAGFACYGSAAEIWSDVGQLGLERALGVVDLRVRGFRKLRSRLGDAAMGYEETGGGEIFLRDDSFDLQVLPQLNEWLRPFFKKDVFVSDSTGVHSRGFQSGLIRDFVRNSVEGQIDTGKMMRSLLAFARQLGVEILTGCEAGIPEYQNGFWEVPIQSISGRFVADRIGICTNAFTTQLFPDVAVKPGRGQVLITKPVKDLKFRGVYHFQDGYYYFRNVGNRVLFGGGRNLDFEGEETLDIRLQHAIQEKLEFYLRNLILPSGEQIEVEHRWAGIMAFGDEKVPILKNFGNGMAMGVRLNGMGIAIGAEIGDRLAEMLGA